MVSKNCLNIELLKNSIAFVYWLFMGVHILIYQTENYFGKKQVASQEFARAGFAYENSELNIFTHILVFAN